MASGFKACPLCRSRAERIVEQDARVAELEAFAEKVRAMLDTSESDADSLGRLYGIRRALAALDAAKKGE